MPDQVRQTVRSLIFRSGFALLFLAALAASNFLIFRAQFGQNASIAATLSVSGEQLALAQASALLADRLMRETDLGQRQALRVQLLATLDQIETNHAALVFGNADRHLPPAPPDFHSLYFEPPLLLDRRLRDYLKLARTVALTPDPQIGQAQPALQALQAAIAEGQLTNGLDLLVGRYHDQGEAKLYRLELLNRWLLVANLCILFFVAILIFGPMIWRIRGDMKTLANLNSELEDRVAERTGALIARARELEHSNQRLSEMRAAMENAVEGIARLDDEGRIVAVNQAFAALFEATRKTLKGETWRGLFEAPDHPSIEQAMHEAESHGKAEIRLHHRRSDESVAYLSVVFVVARNQHERVIGYHVFAKDVTASELAEQALRESEQRLRQLTDHVRQVLWLSDPKREQLGYYNPAFEQVFGQQPKDADDALRLWRESIHPLERNRVLATIAHQAEGPYDEEYRIVRHDGQVRWLRDRVFPIADNEGKVYRVAGVTEDVTDAREMRQKLLRSQRSFENLIMNCDVAMLVTDSSGVVKFVNPAAENLLQRRAESFLGQVFEPSLVSLDTRELPLPDDERGERTAEVNIIRTEWDNEVAHLLIVKDITDRKRAEQALHSYAAELKRSNRELQDFAFVVSHDLQEPLRKITAFGDRLVNRCRDSLGENGQLYLDRMQSAAKRMDTLILDLLTYSRVTTKAQPFRSVDLAEVCAGVISDLEVRIEQSNALVEVGPLTSLYADPTQMRQLLQNLIGNALKFRPPERPPHVQVRIDVPDEPVELPAGLTPAEDVVRLCVQDNGIGFDEKYLDRIFDVFQRLHGRGTYEGTGTGLAVCRKIVRRHGGDITARSTPGEGSTFIVDLPRRQPAPAA